MTRCATPGSRLSAAPDVGLWLFIVKAPGVTVQNLVLDATNGYGAYLSDKNGVDAFAENLVVRGNTVRCNSPECVFVQSPDFAFASGALVDGNVVRNVVVGATGAGGVFVDTHDSELRNNIVSRTGGPGTLFDVACRNLLLGNNLQGTAGVGVVFSVQTGANTYIGNQSIVVNDGAFDCDGDGIVDPNVLTGQGTPLIGASVLRPTGVASTVDGLR